MITWCSGGLPRSLAAGGIPSLRLPMSAAPGARHEGHNRGIANDGTFWYSNMASWEISCLLGGWEEVRLFMGKSIKKHHKWRIFPSLFYRLPALMTAAWIWFL